jgi:hypothetical protein
MTIAETVATNYCEGCGRKMNGQWRSFRNIGYGMPDSKDTIGSLCCSSKGTGSETESSGAVGRSGASGLSAGVMATSASSTCAHGLGSGESSGGPGHAVAVCGSVGGVDSREVAAGGRHARAVGTMETAIRTKAMACLATAHSQRV